MKRIVRIRNAVTHLKKYHYNKKNLQFCKFFEADGRIRTGDLILTNEVKNITTGIFCAFVYAVIGAPILK